VLCRWRSTRWPCPVPSWRPPRSGTSSTAAPPSTWRHRHVVRTRWLVGAPRARPVPCPADASVVSWACRAVLVVPEVRGLLAILATRWSCLRARLFRRLCTDRPCGAARPGRIPRPRWNWGSLGFPFRGNRIEFLRTLFNSVFICLSASCPLKGESVFSSLISKIKYCNGYFIYTFIKIMYIQFYL